MQNENLAKRQNTSSGPKQPSREYQEIYVDKVMLRHLWSRPEEGEEFWKFIANCELQIYICDSHKIKNFEESLL